MWGLGVINRTEFGVLSNVGPDNTQARNMLLMCLKDSGANNQMVYQELHDFYAQYT